MHIEPRRQSWLSEPLGRLSNTCCFALIISAPVCESKEYDVLTNFSSRQSSLENYRQKPETKKQPLFDEEHSHPEMDEEQLLHGQVYVQLLKDLYAAPLFSVYCDMEVQEVASRIK
ncbi:hypothetical protein WJX77_010111 [Trebouxia sp. C0004]